MRVVMPQIEPNSINKLDAVAPPTPVQPRPTPAVSAVWGHFLSLLVHRCPLLSEIDQITDLAAAALSHDRRLETATFKVSDSFSFCFFLLRFSGL